MAKKPDYHGFDDAKNIVEAPKIYMSSDEIALDTTAGWQAAGNEQGEQSILVMNKNGSTNYPGTGAGILFSVRSTGSAEFQLYQDGANDLYITGRSSEKVYFPWKKLAKQETVDSVSQDIQTANDDIKTVKSAIAQLRERVADVSSHLKIFTYSINSEIQAGQTFTYTTDIISDTRNVVAVSLEDVGTGLIATGGVTQKNQVTITVHNGSTLSKKLKDAYVAVFS